MPYAVKNQISKAPIEGGVEISDAQYQDGLAALTAGREVLIEDGFTTRDKAPSPEHTWEDGEWVAPEPPEPPEPEMPTLTPRQLRLMMLQIGLTDANVIGQIDLIADAGEKAAAMIEWQWATQYERDHPLVATLATALEFEPSELDALWVYAAEL